MSSSTKSSQSGNKHKISDALVEIKEHPFLTIEQPELVFIPTSQRLGSQVPDTYMAVLWNPRGQNLIVKWNTTISFVKKSDYKEKDPL